MKTLLIAFLLLATSALADDAATSAAPSKPVRTGAPHTEPKKLKSAGEFGDEIVKLGKGIGKGAAKAGRSAADQVRRNTKKGRPKPGSKPPEAVQRDRSGNP